MVWAAEQAATPLTEFFCSSAEQPSRFRLTTVTECSQMTRRVETDPMRIFQPIMLVCAVAMSFVGALGLPGCARAIGECLRDRPEAA
jgi:hypothetical protein